MSSTLWAAPRESIRWLTANCLPGRLIVTFDDRVRIEEGTAKSGLPVVTNEPMLNALFEEFDISAARRLVPDGILQRLRTAPDFYNTYIVGFRTEYPVLDVLDRFAETEGVRHVEPDLLRPICRTPNDPMWNSQWDKRLVGANSVWDVSIGSSDIICVGIDTGVDWNHPDLVPNLWVNPGEDLDGDRVPWTDPSYPGDYDDLNGEDDDDNGYIDDFLGWDFIESLNNCADGEDCDSQQDNDMSGVNSHGTHVAGIMAARGDNSIGVAGMNWIGTLMALRAGFEDRQGQGYIMSSASLAAILYAAANSARVINMSYGSPSGSGNEQDVMNSAWNQGCILFAASGNDGSTDMQYPAGYDNVIAVNATNSNDRLASWSNRGTWTDLCAPGANPGIMSTIINGYAAWEGTSMASPTAAGVAALVWSLFPNMTNTQLRDLLFNTAEDISSSNPSIPPSYLGHGRVDAANAAAAFYPQMIVSDFSLDDAAGGDGDGRLERSETANLTLYFTNAPGWASGDDVTVAISSEAAYLGISNGTIFLGDIAPGQTVNNIGNPVVLTASSDLDTAFWAVLHATFSSPTGYEATQNFQIRLGRGRVLLVDDDGSANYEQYYLADLQSRGLASDTWLPLDEGDVPSSELVQYAAVIWSCGDQSTSTLTASDQSALSAYLDGGGSLLLIGQNIDEDLRSSTFYSDYLHAQSEQMDGDRQLEGVGGNPISDGMELLLQGGGCAGNGLISPSRILPVNGGESLFTYSNGGVGAVSYSGNYKIAYCAFALEAACGSGGTADHGAVVDAVLRWMGALNTWESHDVSLPQSVVLNGNYPNPFNPTTTISFELDRSTHVSLKVFDTLGRQVADLVGGRMSAGHHSVVFDGRDHASGIYIIRLQAGGQMLSSRMILLK